jgi:Spy/CpxP family protein refolding chaperone
MRRRGWHGPERNSVCVGRSASSVIASASGSAHARGLGFRASGPTGALFRAASSLDLKPEQKASLEKIATEMRDADRASRGDVDGGGARTAMKLAHNELLDGVRAGKIDSAKMAKHYEAMESAATARLDKDAEALNKLHATLDAGQRTAAVASVRAVDEKRAARMKGRDQPDGGRPSVAKMRLERYTRDLDLDADQQKKVQAILPKDDARALDAREQAKKHQEAVLAAFEAPTFDAKKLDSGDAKKIRAPMEEQVKFLGQLLPILRTDQRDRLAKQMDKSEAHARHRGMGDRLQDAPDEDDDP